MFIENISGFTPFVGKRLLLTSNKEKELIIENEDRFVSTYISPILEYTPSKNRDENIYVEGRLVYFASNEFPEFKSKVQSLFRKLKNIVGKINIGKVYGYLKLLETRQLFLYPIGLFF